MYKEGEFTPDAMRALKVSYENLLTEVPLIIRNSPLTNILMTELEDITPNSTNFLDLSTK